LLHIAVLEEDQLIIDQLVTKKEINLNLKNSAGKTPLMLAVKAKNIILIKKLISAGASFEGVAEDTIESEVINQFWMESLRDGDFKAVRSLAKFKPSIIKERIEDVYPVHYAIKNKQKLLYVQMVCLGMNVKDSAVDRARLIISQDPSLLVRILANDVNLDLLRDNNKMLPRSCIEYWDQEKLNKSLKSSIEDNDISLICNLKQLNNNFDQYSLPSNPLVYALNMKKNILAIEMAKLGFKGGKYNEVDSLKNALKLSVDLGEEFYVKEFIRRGVIIDNSDLLASAIENENASIVKDLLKISPINMKYGLHETTVLITAIEVDNSKIIDLLLSENSDLSQSDSNNKTALMHAVEGTSPSNIAKLIAKGADVNQMVVDSSAIMEATILNKPSILEILIKDHNANIDLQDLSGKTSVMKSKDIMVLKILIQQGADLSLVDNQGKSTMRHLVNSYGPSITTNIMEIVSESNDPEVICTVEHLIDKYNQDIYNNNFLKLTKAVMKGRSDSVVTICEEISSIGGGKYNDSTIEEIRDMADDETISLVEEILSPVKSWTVSSPSTLSFDSDLTDIDSWLIDDGSPGNSRKSTLSGRCSSSIDSFIHPDALAEQDKKCNDSFINSLGNSEDSTFTDGDLDSQGSLIYPINPTPKDKVFYKGTAIKYGDIVREGGSLLSSGLDVEVNHAFSSVNPIVSKVLDKKIQR
jgi:ankyrin repeat protein